MRNWITRRMVELGTKKKDLARHLGIPAPRVSELLSGKREIQFDEIIPLAQFLKIPIESLIRLESMPSRGEAVGIDINSSALFIGNPMAQTALSLLINLPIDVAQAVIHEAAFQMSKARIPTKRK